MVVSSVSEAAVTGLRSALGGARARLPLVCRLRLVLVGCGSRVGTSAMLK